MMPSPARLLLVTALALTAHPGPAQSPSAARQSRPKPNLLLVVLDDADVAIVESMPRLRSLLLDKGARFTANVANTPLCGPARAVILSGEYAHNNKVYYNDGPEGGYEAWSRGGYDENNLGAWLQAEGYRTGLFGKYINGFPKDRPETFRPGGWNEFQGVLSDREAHNNRFTLNENGVLKTYDARSGGYQTDLLSRRLEAFIRGAEGTGDRPFFALLALTAPHVPPEPAERHLGAFPNDRAPRKPSFDESDLSDKPKALRDQATPLTKAQQQDIDATYRAMRQSLLSVEDSMESILKTLAETGQLSRTYVFFTSDNGWMRGEHRIPAEKYAPYEESILVPLVVRGPGIAEGSRLDQVAGLVDLAPTFLDLAGSGAAGMARGDGRSLAPLLRLKSGEKAPWRDSILIEHFGGGAPFRVRGYFGLRSPQSTYVEYSTGEKEYYDLLKDPYQMDNLAARLDAHTLERLHARVAALRACRGRACREAERAGELSTRPRQRPPS